ncbi:MAG: PIN domain-containing protein [Bacteroidales bacterium]|nr:PIN domain-containing protein [Bacteroidales bacterium]
MKKIFLDTNILLDSIQQREKKDYAEMILQFGKEGKIQNFASFLSFANIAYIIRKNPPETINSALKTLSAIVNVLPMDNALLQKALTQPSKDFEDMLQYQCALTAGCDVIVTNNTKHFQDFCTISLKTSEDFLLEWNETD